MVFQKRRDRLVLEDGLLTFGAGDNFVQSDPAGLYWKGRLSEARLHSGWAALLFQYRLYLRGLCVVGMSAVSSLGIVKETFSFIIFVFSIYCVSWYY